MQSHSGPRHPAHSWLLGRLKGRFGVAVVLAAVVLTSVGIGRAIGGGGPHTATVQAGSGAQTAPVTAPSTQDDGVEGGPSVAPAEPSLAPGAAGPVKVAGQFIQAWLRSQLSPQQWHAGLMPHSTPALARKLSGVDPGGVPAERTTGDARLARQGGGAASVTVPVDSGTVQLRMVVTDGEWLVDGVDWSRG